MDLAQFLEEEDLTVDEFAAMTGICRSTITQYKYKKRIPLQMYAHKIFKATKGKVTFKDICNEDLYGKGHRKTPKHKHKHDIQGDGVRQA